MTLTVILVILVHSFGPFVHLVRSSIHCVCVRERTTLTAGVAVPCVGARAARACGDVLVRDLLSGRHRRCGSSASSLVSFTSFAESQGFFPTEVAYCVYTWLYSSVKQTVGQNGGERLETGVEWQKVERRVDFKAKCGVNGNGRVSDCGHR